MGSHTAFFYGTLMAPAVLTRVLYGPCPTTPSPPISVTPAILHHHTRHRVLNCDYPGLLPTPSIPQSSIRGTFVRGLTDGDIWRLDVFEGREYERRKVRVKLLEDGNDGEANGKMEEEDVETETYIWIAGEDALDDGEWDFDVFVKEKMRMWVDGNKEYNEVDVAVKEKKDDPTGGRGITRYLKEERGAEIINSAV